jgi:hypothetical protein
MHKIFSKIYEFNNPIKNKEYFPQQRIESIFGPVLRGAFKLSVAVIKGYTSCKSHAECKRKS